MAYERSEKTRIIVAFGDITGFTAFEESVTNDLMEFSPFFDKFDGIIDEVERKSGYSFQDTGDGFLCSVDLVKGHNCSIVADALVNLWGIYKRIQKLIRDKEPPKPAGFRIRIASGYVHRKIKKSGKTVLRGRHINMAHHMLEVSKSTPILCHDSLKQCLSDAQIKKHGFSFAKFIPSRYGYDGISMHDAHSLWVFKMSEKRIKAIRPNRKRG